MSADEESGCLSRCTNAIVRFLETGFYKFGRLVGGYPWVTIGIASVIALCCAAGMIKFQQESRNEVLWVPVGSPSLDHQKLAEEYFPSESRFEVYVIEAENVLMPSVLQKMLALHKEVLDIVVGDENWESLCYRLGPNCFATSLLELWSFNSTVINSLSQEDILNKINETDSSPVYFSPVDIESQLGGIEKDSNGRITGAKATTMTWFIIDQRVFDKASGDEVDVVGEAWELKFLELADDKSTSDFTIYKFTGRSFGDEAGESISGDLTLLAAGYMLIIIYVMFSMSKFTFIEHKIYLSFAGILTAGLSIIAAMGLASAFGQFYGPVHSVLPFLLLGIGVDDMFVLVAAWYNLDEEEKKLDVREQVARSLKHSGVSITVTSVTDFCAFLIGATTILPALRSFCIYCGLGIIFLFIFSITFFLAWLVIDHRRYDARRDACCCCIRHGEDYTPNACGQRNFLQEFFYKIYSPALLNIPVKIIVILITFGLLGVCIWGTVTWEQNFDFRWFLPTDGALNAYFDATEQYFPANGFPTAIYLDTVDYYEERQEMNDLYNNFKDSDWIQESSADSWYESYQGWLNEFKAGEPGLNTDNWPNSETLFYDWLDEFLASQEGVRFAREINFNEDTSSDDRIIASRITADHILFQNSREEVSAMDDVRAIAKNAGFKAGEGAAFGYAELYLNYESNKVIQNELLRNIGLAAACVFIVVLLLLANIGQTILVFSCVIFTLVDLSGTLNFWGITIDTVVAVQLILAIGLAVDYSVHIGHTFMIFSGTRNDRSKATLGCMGAAVFNGGFSTFLAFVLLAGSNSYIFTTFFKIFFLVVLYGLFHGLVFLPVMLSLVGPSPYRSAKPADPSSDSKAPPPRSVTPEATQEITKDGEKKEGSRISPVYNPAFVKDDEVEMNVPPQGANGFANHEWSQTGSYKRPQQQHDQHRHDQRPHYYQQQHHLQSPRHKTSLSHHGSAKSYDLHHHHQNHDTSRHQQQQPGHHGSSNSYGRRPGGNSRSSGTRVRPSSMTEPPNYVPPPGYVGYVV